MVVTEAISEPGSGSQWWSLASRAEDLGEGRQYHVRATKSWATTAGHADLYIVSTMAPSASSDREHAMFVIQRDEGTITNGTWNGLGLRGNMSSAMTFDCVVDCEAMIFGRPGDDGLRLYNESNQPLYHLGLSAAYLGVGEAAIASAKDRIKGRRYLGNPAGFGEELRNYPVAQRHVGSMIVRLEQMSGLVQALARGIDGGESFEALAVRMTAARVAAAEGVFSICSEAMMSAGGSAYIKGGNLERHFRDATAASLMGPNDDFCKELIGKLELGLGSYHDL